MPYKNKTDQQAQTKRYYAANWHKLYHRYGMAKGDFERLFAAQNEVCAICKRPERSATSQGKKKRLSVDHDHITGAIRGLLCQYCNIGIAKFEDSPDRLRVAADYLLNSKENTNG